MKEHNEHIPQPGTVRIALGPGASVFHLVAAAVEKSIRAGAGRIAMKHFLWPDYRLLPALAHPGGRARVRAPRR